MSFDPDDGFLMAQYQGREEHQPESEPLILEHHGETVTLVTHEGARFTLDREELLHQLEAA